MFYIMVNRRDFLKGASLLTLGALAACNNNGAAAADGQEEAPAHKTLGLQIYTLGPELYAGDVNANLKKIKDMGIDELELAGYDPATGQIGGIDPAEFKKMCDDNGLSIPSSHVNPPQLFSGAAGREDRSGKSGGWDENLKAPIVEGWKKITEDHAKLGCEYLVQPMMPMFGLTSEGPVKSFADLLNKSGEVVKAGGLKFGYHNHNMEFVKVQEKGEQDMLGTVLHRVEGTHILQLFMDNTDAANVAFELDVYWTVMGQEDPVEWINKHADRIQLLHIKDRVILGDSGMMNFKNIFDAYYANGLKHFFIEIEDTNSGKQYDRVQASADFLTKASFVK